MGPLNRKLLRDLWRIRAQAFAIALVVGSGVAMYIMSMGTLYSLEETRDAYYERYRFAQVFTPLKRAPNRLIKDIAEISGVRTVDARVAKSVILDIPGLAEPASGRILSLPDSRESKLNVLHLRQGRLLEGAGVDDVLVNEAFAMAHGFQPGDGFAAIINGHKRQLTITGIVLSPEYVYALGPGALMPDDKRFAVIWMGEKALKAAFDLEGSFTEATMTLERDARREDILLTLDKLTEPYGGIRSYARKDQISNWFVNNEISQLRSMGNVAPPLFLAIAAFLLHMVITRMIETERGQIGLLKAFGYSDFAIAWLYIKLTLAIVAVGLLMGVASGTWLGRELTELYTEYFRFPFLFYIVDGSLYATAVLFSMAAGLLGAVGAVWKAARLMPAVAMTAPPPTSYRTAWVERLLRLKRLSEPNRMILRHALRWPVRSSMSVLGTALAISILISSIFFLDSLRHLVDVHFFQTQRQDVMQRFTSNLDASSMTEIAGLPGVLAVEPFRSVPVRLLASHRKRYVNLIGLVRGGTLYRTLDEDLKPVELPEQGLALSTKMADNLAVGLGDTVTLEVKEGRRPVFEVTVTAIVEEYIASPVYMNYRALHRLLGEDPVVNGATLRIDKDFDEVLYHELKAIPSIASVSIQTVLVESFRHTIEENMGLMITFNIAFAVIIAFGVVYNSARISLSERARELASLRVMGFTRGETAYILLGELALLILTAIPVGCLFGIGLATLWAASMDSDLFRLPIVFERDTLAWSIVITLGAATISGMIVRRKLDTMDLIEALKTRE